MCKKDKDLKGEMGNDERYDQSKPASTNRRVRFAWCLQHSDWSMEQGETVLFID